MYFSNTLIIESSTIIVSKFKFISSVYSWLSMFDDNRIIDETVTAYKRRFDRRDSVVFQRDKPKPQYVALNNCLVSVRFSRVIWMVGLSMERG